MPWYVWIIIVVVGLVALWLLGRRVFRYFGWLPSASPRPGATLTAEEAEEQRRKIAEDFKIIRAQIKADMDEIRAKCAKDVEEIKKRWGVPQ